MLTASFSKFAAIYKAKSQVGNLAQRQKRHSLVLVMKVFLTLFNLFQALWKSLADFTIELMFICK